MFILLSLVLMIISFIVLYQSIDYPCIQNYVMGSLIGIISSLILLIKSINDAVSDSLSDKNRDKILDSFLYPAANYENINTIKAYDWDDYKSNDISKKVIKKYRNSIKISVLEDNKTN